MTSRRLALNKIQVYNQKLNSMNLMTHSRRNSSSIAASQRSSYANGFLARRALGKQQANYGISTLRSSKVPKIESGASHHSSQISSSAR